MAKARDGTRTHSSHLPGQDFFPNLGAVTKLRRCNYIQSRKPFSLGARSLGLREASAKPWGVRRQSLCFCLEQPEEATQQVSPGGQADKGLGKAFQAAGTARAKARRCPGQSWAALAHDLQPHTAHTGSRCRVSALTFFRGGGGPPKDVQRARSQVLIV